MLNTPWELTQTFDFEGREVKYDILGQGPELVIVHGTPWSSYNLRHLIIGLAEHYRVHFYDLIGYGQSDKAAGDVSLGIQNKLLGDLIEHWGLVRPIAIGHDFGGTTVLRTHILNKKSFSKIVLINPVALKPWGSPFYKLVQENEYVFAALPDTLHRALVIAYMKSAAFSELTDEVISRTASYWCGKNEQQAFYRQIAQSIELYTDEIEFHYGELSTETHIFWGEEDTWLPVINGLRLKALIPESTLTVIPNAGHLVIEEQHHNLLTLIKNKLIN
mgnify:CR=1 FL=1